MEEVRDRFGSFQQTDRRSRLYLNLSSFVHDARSSGIVLALILNGSFVTDSANPNDIDMIIALRPGHDMAAELGPFEYNVVSRRQVKQRYGLDALVAIDGSGVYHEYVSFFEQVRGRSGVRKGLLRVTL